MLPPSDPPLSDALPSEATPSESSVREKLRQRGVAEHVLREGAEGLIAAWRRFVAQVEEGYPLGLDDYRNDLDVRELIAVAGLDAQVSAEDRRLRQALTATDKTIWESDVPEAFWVRGFPGNAAGELLADLRAEGLA
jgi:hypothetical protein